MCPFDSYEVLPQITLSRMLTTSKYREQCPQPTTYASVSGRFLAIVRKFTTHVLVAAGTSWLRAGKGQVPMFSLIQSSSLITTKIRNAFPGTDNVDCLLPWTVRVKTRGQKEPRRRDTRGGAAKPSLPHPAPVPFKLCRPGETITACYTTGRSDFCLTRTGVIYGRHLPVWLAPVKSYPRLFM